MYMDDKTKLRTAQAVCFGIGITIGLSVVWFLFGETGPFAGALGGIFGAMIGIVIFRLYLKIAG